MKHVIVFTIQIPVDPNSDMDAVLCGSRIGIAPERFFRGCAYSTTVTDGAQITGWVY